MADGNRRYEQNIGRTGYILIVNSDPAMREAVSSYFSDRKFPTKCLSNWSEVKCTGNHPVIMDQPLGRLRFGPIEKLSSESACEDLDPRTHQGGDDVVWYGTLPRRMTSRTLRGGGPVLKRE